MQTTSKLAERKEGTGNIHTMIDTQKYIRKPLYVDAVRITTANFEEIATWCQGEIQENGPSGKKCIKVRVHNPKNVRQTQAVVGDWLLYTERGYKVYTNKAFHASFDPVETAEERDERAAQELDAPLSVDEEAEILEQELQAEEPPPAAVAHNEAAVDEAEREARFDHASVPEGKTVLTLEEQAELTNEEIRELLKSGEYVLAQDLAA